MTETIKLSDLQPDNHNANKGTERGRALLEKSLHQYGAGRSILLDKNGRIIAGNKTAQTAGEIGIEDVVIIRTDGKKLVAVMREDLDLNDEEARMLAYADNRVGQVDLEWDAAEMLADMTAGLPLDEFWFDWELEQIAAIGGGPDDPNEHWKGMPEFEHKDLTDGAAFVIRIFLQNEEELKELGELIGKDLTDRKFVWFSKQPISPTHEVR